MQVRNKKIMKTYRKALKEEGYAEGGKYHGAAAAAFSDESDNDDDGKAGKGDAEKRKKPKPGKEVGEGGRAAGNRKVADVDSGDEEAADTETGGEKASGGRRNERKGGKGGKGSADVKVNALELKRKQHEEAKKQREAERKAREKAIEQHFKVSLDLLLPAQQRACVASRRVLSYLRRYPSPCVVRCRATGRKSWQEEAAGRQLQAQSED